MYYPQSELTQHLSRGKITSWDDIHAGLGNTFYTLEGALVERGKGIPRNHRLPTVFDTRKIAAGDLIPSTSWGSSLANMLTKKSWDALREPLIKRNNNVCEMCGTQHKSLDVHERWSYAFPSEADINSAQRTDSIAFGIQKLDGLITVCKECHKMFHLGLANVRGELDQVLARISAINQWSPTRTDNYCDLVFERFEAASKVHWLLDFAELAHPDGGLTLKGAWRPHEEEARLLTNGENVTGVLNISWKHPKDTQWRTALTQQDLEN